MPTERTEFAKLYFDKYSQLDIEGITRRLGLAGITCLSFEVSNDQSNGYDSYPQLPYFKYDGYIYSDFEIDGVIESLINASTPASGELL